MGAMQEIQGKCMGVEAWAMQTQMKLNEGGQPHNPIEAADMLSKVLPGGLSCTEKFIAGPSRLLLDAITMTQLLASQNTEAANGDFLLYASVLGFVTMTITAAWAIMRRRKSGEGNTYSALDA